MNNPVLLSETFERAAYNLKSSLDNFRTDQFDEAVRQFSRSVDKLQQIVAMQAENDQRKAIGHSMAYDEAAFMSIQ